MKYKDLLLNEI